MTPASIATDIKRLRGFLTELIEIGDAEFSQSHQVKPDDHLAFMALSFTSRQIEHGRSMLTLGNSMDTGLIARSMLEGLAQLLWASHLPQERPLLWRAFAHVIDWRRRKERDRNGTAVTPEERAAVDQGIAAHGLSFLSEKALKAKAKGKPLQPDPYSLNWYGEKEREVFAAVGGDVAYAALYGPFSEWHHWRIGGFARLIGFDAAQGKFTIKSQDDSFVASSLATACQCLYQTLKALENIVPGGMAAGLDDWYKRYVQGPQSATNP